MVDPIENLFCKTRMRLKEIATCINVLNPLDVCLHEAARTTAQVDLIAKLKLSGSTLGLGDLRFEVDRIDTIPIRST